MHSKAACTHANASGCAQTLDMQAQFKRLAERDHKNKVQSMAGHVADLVLTPFCPSMMLNGLCTGAGGPGHLPTVLVPRGRARAGLVRGQVSPASCLLAYTSARTAASRSRASCYRIWARTSSLMIMLTCTADMHPEERGLLGVIGKRPVTYNGMTFSSI